MFYFLSHVLANLQSHILNMIRQFDFPDGVVSVAVEKEDEDSSSLTPIGQSLRQVPVNEYASILSSDKSLVQGITYGGDILQYASNVNKLASVLLADEEFDHQALLNKRSKPYVRNLFIDNQGQAIDPIGGILALRKAAIRLGDGLALRSQHPELGYNTFHNCQTAIKVLKDLDEFFKESSIGYYDYRVNRSGTVYFWES